MRNPIRKKGKFITRVGALLLASSMTVASLQKNNVNPFLHEVLATETTDSNTTIKLEELQKLQKFLYFLCSFSTQKGGDVTYVKGTKENNYLNHEKLELGKKNLHSDCSWFIFWGMVYAELLEDDTKEMIKSAKWGNNGYQNSFVVDTFEKGEPWDYSKAAPRRYYLGGI